MEHSSRALIQRLTLVPLVEYRTSSGDATVFSGLIFTALAITLVLNKQPVSPFFGRFFRPTTLFTMSSRFTAKLNPSLAFFSCLTGKSCSSSFTLLLKTELALALVRFWYFLVYYIHSDIYI